MGATLNVQNITLLFTFTLHKYIYPPVSKVYPGSFRVSVIHQSLTWTTRSLTGVCDHSYACVYTQGLQGTLTVYGVVHKILSGQIFPEDLNPQCDLNLRIAINNCHTTLWHVMVYHYTKPGCKRFRSVGVPKPRAYIHTQEWLRTHDKDPVCSPCQSLVDYGNMKRPSMHWKLIAELALRTTWL